MLAVLVSLAVFLAVGIGMLWSELDWGYQDFVDHLFAMFVAAVTGGLAAGSTFFGITGLANLAVDHDDHYQGVDLVAIRDGSTLAGAFVFGSGSVGPAGQYSFYYRDGDAKVLASIPSSGVKVYEDSEHAYAIYYAGCTLERAWLAPCLYDGTPWREIHVPPGSVKTTPINLGLNP